MTRPFRGVINIDIRDSVPDWEPYMQPVAPQGSPNVLYIQPGNFSLVGEGLNVGSDRGEPVTADYAGASPYAFTGGRIRHAIVDVSGEPFIDLEKEAVAMMARE